MEDFYIVANWKENKTQEESLIFLEEFSKIYSPKQNIKVIICPSYLSVPSVRKFVKENNLNVEIGVQDISKFEEGAHTGEVSAKEAKEFAAFAIIGHSERRALGETDQEVESKTELAISNNIEPIVCVIGEDVPVPGEAKIVAYEPIESIGTGNPDTPENADKVAGSIRTKNSHVQRVLYGGSVTENNVENFRAKGNIGGILVGGASLDPKIFSAIINQC